MNTFRRISCVLDENANNESDDESVRVLFDKSDDDRTKEKAATTMISQRKSNALVDNSLQDRLKVGIEGGYDDFQRKIAICSKGPHHDRRKHEEHQEAEDSESIKNCNEISVNKMTIVNENQETKPTTNTPRNNDCYIQTIIDLKMQAATESSTKDELHMKLKQCIMEKQELEQKLNARVAAETPKPKENRNHARNASWNFGDNRRVSLNIPNTLFSSFTASSSTKDATTAPSSPEPALLTKEGILPPLLSDKEELRQKLNERVATKTPKPKAKRNVSWNFGDNRRSSLNKQLSSSFTNYLSSTNDETTAPSSPESALLTIDGILLLLSVNTTLLTETTHLSAENNRLEQENNLLRTSFCAYMERSGGGKIDSNAAKLLFGKQKKPRQKQNSNTTGRQVQRQHPSSSHQQVVAHQHQDQIPQAALSSHTACVDSAEEQEARRQHP